MTDHTPSGLPQPQTVAGDAEKRAIEAGEQFVRGLGLGFWPDHRQCYEMGYLAALSAPAVETVAVQEATDPNFKAWLDDAQNPTLWSAWKAGREFGRGDTIFAPLPVAPNQRSTGLQQRALAVAEESARLANKLATPQAEPANACEVCGIRYGYHTTECSALATSAQPVGAEQVTPEMIQAGAKAAREYYERTGGNDPTVIYLAMRAASPQGQPVGAARQFSEWLNERRMADVSSVFHDIVAHYEAALANRAIPAEQAAPTEPASISDLIYALEQWKATPSVQSGPSLDRLYEVIRRLAAHPQGAADRSAEAALIDAAILWAYCPSAGGYREGWAVEDTCEQLTAAVYAYTGFVNEDDPYWSEEEMRAAMGTPAAAEPGKGEGK